VKFSVNVEFDIEVVENPWRFTDLRIDAVDKVVDILVKVGTIPKESINVVTIEERR